jgi:hypothetical protein
MRPVHIVVDFPAGGGVEYDGQAKWLALPPSCPPRDVLDFLYFGGSAHAVGGLRADLWSHGFRI